MIGAARKVGSRWGRKGSELEVEVVGVRGHLVRGTNNEQIGGEDSRFPAHSMEAKLCSKCKCKEGFYLQLASNGGPSFLMCSHLLRVPQPFGT